MAISTNSSFYHLTCLALAIASVSTAGATDGDDVATFTGGTFNWNTTSNWTGGFIADGIGAVALFNNNYTANVSATFDNGSSFTLGALSFVDATPSNHTFNLQAGTGNTATLKFDDTDNISNLTINQSTAGVPFQFGGQGTLNVSGDANENLIIDSTGTNAVRFAAGINWTGFTGKMTLNTGRYQTEAGNVLPGHAEVSVGSGVQIRAVFNDTRNQSLRGLSGGDATSFVGTNDNASATGTLTLGANSIATDVYNFTGILGGDAFTIGQANSNFGLFKSGAGTQQLSGDNLYTGTTIVNAGILKLGHANALGSSAEAAFTSIRAATVDLNGQTTAEKFWSDNAAATITNSNATAASITTDLGLSNNLNFTGSGDITVPRLIATAIRTVTKQGSGTLTTTGAGFNNLTAWDIQEGTVIFANTSGSASDRAVAINGGTLRLSGANTNLVNDVETFTLNSGTFDLNGKSETVASIGGSGGSITNSQADSSASLVVGGGASGSSSASFNGVIQNGAGTTSLTKTGSGTQTLSGANTYTGATTLTGGTLLLGANNTLPSGSSVVLNGGRLETGGFSNNSGSLSMTASSVIDFTGTSSVLTFASNSASWTGTLSVWNWNGAVGATGGSEQFRLTSGTLDSTQLASIQFYEGGLGSTPIGSGATYLSGELVPVPEPAALFSGGILGATVLLRRQRSRRQDLR